MKEAVETCHRGLAEPDHLGKAARRSGVAAESGGCLGINQVQSEGGGRVLR